MQGHTQRRPDAFAALYDRYAPALFRVAWTLLRSRVDAEDAVQEVFLGLVRSSEVLARVENWRAYLFSALRHSCARLATRKLVGAPLPLDDVPARPADEEGAVDPHLYRRMEDALAALPAEQREVLTLKIDGGLTFAEVAAILAIRPNTAASRYRYALEKMRTLLDEARDESGTAPSASGGTGKVAGPSPLPGAGGTAARSAPGGDPGGTRPARP
jgi:RNA polymerase sigma-70 factor (ECF subfamily)